MNRHISAPSLYGEEDVAIRPYSLEFSDEDSIASEPYHNDHPMGRHADVSAYSWSESEHSPVAVRKEWRKKRRAPPPPGPPPPYPSPGSLRHSYAFEQLRNRTSTDSETMSLTFESSRTFFHSSTDSENVPEPLSLGSSLTTPDSDEPPSLLGHPSPHFSPRDKSRLQALKNALRSPRNLRKNSKREPREEEHVGFRVRKNATIEPPDSSLWTLGLLPDDVDAWEADTEFEIKRIPEYDKYLNDLLDETDSSHPDFEDLTKAANRVKNMVKDREEEIREAENEQRMETVQERFPYDDLQLQDKNNKTQPKPRGLSLRRRSAPSAVVFRSLSGNRSRSSSALWSQNNMGRKDADTFTTIKQAADSSRLYIMEGPVQFAMGMQTQDRYIFLFSDLLLVAKQKNSTTFKLKFRVPLCDVWLSTCVDEVTELTRPLDRSFVIGWPTCNVAATFKDAATKDKWMTKLSEQVQEEKQRVEPKEIGLKVVLRDDNKSESCQLTVGNTLQAKDVLQDCLSHLNIPDSDSKDYKLWVWSDKEGSPYPLIGHETPFSIKVSHLREIARTRGEDNMTLAELSSVIGDEPSNIKCEFILKQKKSPKQHSQDESSHKIKKSKKSPLLHIFKRGGRDVNDRRRDDKTNNNTAAPQGKLFGHPLASVCDSDNNPPKAVVDLLTILFREGPHTTGILRKSANAKQSRELKERIDQGEELDECHVTIVGSILKEYLRSLPDPLLMEDLHDEWIKIPKMDSQEEKLAHVKQLLSRMPACNLSLLKRILCVLHHIQREADINKMNSFNLSLCISPSLLWRKDNIDLSSGAPAVEFMIDRCVDLFGEDVLQLLGDPQQFKSRQDSGTDSDSMHSVLSMQESGGGLRRDDSSIDSLVERELYTNEGEGGESSPKLVKSHLSPSNLSRDSGLTLSDTQLYDDDSTDLSDPRLPARGYHRGHSHLHDSRDDYDFEGYHEATLNPVPPPRKRRHGGLEHEHSGRLESGLRGRDKRHTLHSSVSSSRLLDHCNAPLSSSLKTDRNRAMLTHPPFSTQFSEDFHHPHHHHHHHQGLDRDEIQEYKKATMDIGMLKKSASGAHLILDDETLPSRKFSESGGMGVPRQQSSGVDSTPPLSPQSKYSFSSRDSVISDSSFGAGSRENSIHSQPQTPDADHADRLPPWLPSAEVENPRLAMSLNLAPQHGEMAGKRLSASYHSSELRSVQNVRYLVSPPASPVYELEQPGFSAHTHASRQEQAFQAPPPSPWPGKSREAEDVTLTSSPQIHITQCSSSSDEKLDDRGEDEDSTPRPSPNKAFPLEIPHGTSQVAKQMHKYSHNVSKGSPPPRVILDSLRSPRRGKDPAPVRASHDSHIVAQVQRGGGLSPASDVSDVTSAFSSFDAARSMDAINDAEYIPVKPRLTIIRREESMTSNVSSYSSGSGSSLGKDSLSSLTLSTSPSTHSTASSSSSSSGGSNHTLSGERPSRPPEYTEALQRKFMIQRDLPMEAATQKSASEKAKALYEESLQKYLQERYEQKHVPATRKISDPGTSSSSSMGSYTHSIVSSVSSDHDDRAAKEDVYVTLKNQQQQQQQQQGSKHPRQIYLESLQRYEQQQSTCVEEDGAGFSRTVKSVSSESQQRVLDTSSESERTGRGVHESRTRQRFLELSETRTSVKRDTQRPKSMLEIPSSSLHRSLSDSADRLNKLGQKSPRSHSQVRDSDSSEQQYQPQQQQQQQHYKDSGVVRDSASGQTVVRDSDSVLQSSRRKASEPERRERSESSPARHYFPAASCFYRPEDSPRSGKNSPASASPRAQSPRLDTDSGSRYCQVDTSVRSARVQDIAVVRGSRGDAKPFVKSPSLDHSASVVSPRGSSAPLRVRCESPTLRSPRMAVNNAVNSAASSADHSAGRGNSGVSSGSVASTAASSSSSSSANNNNNRGRTELGWSVKNLRKHFTAEQQGSSDMDSPRSSPSSSSSRPAPPPYQDPPPFRRLQDRSRLSTSSNSSNGSSSTGRSASPTSRTSASSSRRLGPQNMSVDSSSSEELAYYNSRWSRARSESSGGLSDQEMTSSYTDISYV